MAFNSAPMDRSTHHDGDEGVSIVRNAEVDDTAWDAYVSRHPLGSLYHGTAWYRVIETTFAKRVHRCAAISADGEIRGVLPLVRLNGWFLPDMLISLPYCSHGGVIADNASLASALMAEATRFTEEIGCDVLELRGGPSELEAAWRTRDDKVRMLLRLPGSLEELGKSLGSKRRSQIKRSLRENPEVRVGGAELIDAFYAVFAKKMRDLGTPVYPRSLFENVERYLRNYTRLIVVFIDGSPVAGGVVIRHRDTLEIPWAASDRVYDRVSVNMLLYWEALRFAIDSGSAHFDFGRCTRDSSTFQFKRQWGAEPVVLRWQYLAHAERSMGTSAGDTARRLTALWQKLPLPVANWVGPRITGNLPW